MDERVRILEVPSKIMAVRQFSGSWSERNYLKNEDRLLEGIREAGFEVVSTPVSARYNSPFTPWFLRRNEILIPVADPARND